MYYDGYVIEYVITENGESKFVTLSEIYDTMREVEDIMRNDNLIELNRREFIDGLLTIIVEFPNKC